ncbi:MAG: HAD hydrolase-like protein [Candidatus Micrarchaeota archaeon]|nr:HAD hydrolase-like protein [Candidatus Micrarchaeota archaeon]
MKKKLFLFDIDGVLAKVGLKPPLDYWKIAIQKHFEIETSISDIYNVGKTDKAILVEMLAVKGITNPNEEKLRKSLEDVGKLGAQYIEQHGATAIAGSGEFAAALKNNNYVGLLTGNCQERALAKIKKLGLLETFSPVIGAFGEEAEKRSDLVEIAMTDAEKKTSIVFAKSDVYIIGDTVRDVWCAKEACVKVIAVATGPESFEALEKEKSDFIFRDFNDISTMIEKVLK